MLRSLALHPETQDVRSPSAGGSDWPHLGRAGGGHRHLAQRRHQNLSPASRRWQPAVVAQAPLIELALGILQTPAVDCVRLHGDGFLSSAFFTLRPLHCCRCTHCVQAAVDLLALCRRPPSVANYANSDLDLGASAHRWPSGRPSMRAFDVSGWVTVGLFPPMSPAAGPSEWCLRCLRCLASHLICKAHFPIPSAFLPQTRHSGGHLLHLLHSLHCTLNRQQRPCARRV